MAKVPDSSIECLISIRESISPYLYKNLSDLERVALTTAAKLLGTVIEELVEHNEREEADNE